MKALTPAYAIQPNGAFSPYTSADSYNYGGLSYLQRAAERYTAGSFFNYDINDKTNVYSSFMYARNSSAANYGPSGLFSYTAAQIPCATPLFSAQERATFCDPALVVQNHQAFPNTPAGDITLYVGRRAVENGPRVDNYVSNSFRQQIGVKGTIVDGLTYDAYAQVGISMMRDSEGGFVNTTSALKALNVVSVGGVPTCQSVVDGSDPNCVPWNIFKSGGVTPAALKYISVPATLR